MARHSPGGLPAIMRARGAKGQHIGSYFSWFAVEGQKTKTGNQKYQRVSYATKDLDKAKVRRLEAVNGRRDFVNDDPERFPVDVAAVEPAPVVPVIPLPMARQLAAAEPQPIVLPPEPAPVDQRASEPAPSTGVESPPSDDWTKDATRAAGAPDTGPMESVNPTAAADSGSTPDGSTKGAPAAPVDDGQVRIKDLEMLGPVFVTASRIAVQLQVAFHVLIARWLFKTELDPIREEMPKDVVGFMKAQGEKWPDTDPREPGRAMWEKFGRRICPDDLVLPDWALAPALVAVGTLPIQVSNRKPVVKTKPNVPVIPAQPTTLAPAPKPPEPTPAATAPTTPDPARARHIPVMSPDAVS